MTTRLVATFSILARDPVNGDLGIAVASKFLAVGSVVPWARAAGGAPGPPAPAGVGDGPARRGWVARGRPARASVACGADGLVWLERGRTAQEALHQLLADDDLREHRQIGIVD